MRRFFLSGAVLAIAWPAAATASAENAAPIEPQSARKLAGELGCAAPPCRIRLTPAQLLAHAEKLIVARDFAAAKPLVEALGMAPGYELEHRFLGAYIAVEQGRYDQAVSQFRAILNNDPHQTRVRLELARALMLQGKEAGADYHLRLAQQDSNLPENIARTIRATRSILRDRRIWRFNLDFGFAPDSNINSATAAETIDVNFGPFRLPLELNEDARERSGLGQTAGFSGGLRVRLGEKTAILASADGQMVNYKGKEADDFGVQIAAGPELKLGSDTSLALQAVGRRRWFGGELATTEYGAKVNLQRTLGTGQRIGLELDGRRSRSRLSDALSGWQFGANATYERIVARSFIASASLFARRDSLASEGFSNISYGVSGGIGGELPLGVNAGLSASVSRAVFDSPILLYSTEKREDWRYHGRAYLGLRSVRVLGFSPSVDYVFSRADSNYELYRSKRHRANFKLTRYF